MHKACTIVCTTAGTGVWVDDRVVFCYVVCRWYAIDHATRQHVVKKRAHATCSPKNGATCHARTPEEYCCAVFTGVGWR